MNSSLLVNVSHEASLKTTEAAAIEINSTDTVWILVCICNVFIMIPGLAYYYGGIGQKKNQLTFLLTSVLACSVIGLQWFFWGYSLTFSQTGSFFIGNLDYFCLIKLGKTPHALAPTIPPNAFMTFQGMFAEITPYIAFGSAAERNTIPVFILFLFAWSTLVYDFIAYWTWSPRGWLHTFGVLDYAGGTPVHVCSGFSALAYALVVGPRKAVDHKSLKPSSLSDIYFGATVLWFGWLGFNGGSELAVNSRAVHSLFVSNLSACVGGLTWLSLEMIFNRTKKMSLAGFCNGAIAGLVAITPATGFVSSHYALVFGFVGATACFFTVDLKKITKYKYDDTCDVFAMHGTGGIVGCLLTGIFAENSVATMSGGASIKGGWVDGHFEQILYQILSIVVTAVWSFLFTVIILKAIGLLPFFRLRLNETEETIGNDLVELGEVADGIDLNLIEKSKRLLKSKASQDELENFKISK